MLLHEFLIELTVELFLSTDFQNLINVYVIIKIIIFKF